MRQGLFILFLFLIVTSCRKESNNQTEVPFYKINSSLYPYLFNSGSYWIYKNTANAIIDSVTLTAIQRDTFTILPTGTGEGPQGYEEYFDAKYLSSYTASNYDEQLFGYVISRGLYNGGYVFLSGKQKGDSVENAIIVDVLDTLKIENEIYRNITKMKVTKDNYINGNFYLYYADSIGVVKRETITNDTVVQAWNLLRHNVTLYKY